jgi:nicotinamidase-related amidase
VFNNRIKVKETFILYPKKAALLVIDVQNHFASPHGRSYKPASKVAVPNILKLINWCESASVPVIFTQHCHKNVSDLGMIGKFYDDHIREGEWDSEIIDDLNSIKRAALIKKDTYDAFWNTELQDILASLKVEQLIICGGITHLCCETTARSAFVRGFEVYFVSDATFSSTLELHEGSLCSIANGFGLVTTTEGILSCR